MGYKILIKSEGKDRREGWDNKEYKTKTGALKEVDRSVEKYKGSKYVKDVKHKNFKIVKTAPRQNITDPLGLLNNRKKGFGGFRL